MSNIQLAINLRRLRLDHNYTQQQLGKMLNLSRQAYSNYETGKRIPDIDLLIRIADIYGGEAGTAHHTDLYRERCGQ